MDARADDSALRDDPLDGATDRFPVHSVGTGAGAGASVEAGSPSPCR